MAIGTAAAIIGSAVIGAGASAYSSSKAAKKAAKASNYAADQNAAVSREIYNQTRSDLAPYNQAGQAGLAALMSRLGVQPAAQAAPTGAPPPAPSPSRPADAPGGFAGPAHELAASQPDWGAYGAANPDVQAEWQRIVQTGNAGNDKFNGDPNAFYAWHYQTYGQPEGRALPGSTPQPSPTAPPVAADPAAPTGEPVFEYGERQPDTPPPTFGGAPSVGSYIDPSKFQVDPGYKFRVSEALKGVNAASAARGKLRSGDAALALAKRASDLADQGYNDWFNRQLAAFDRDYGGFIDDRSYQTNLWNTQQARRDNLFSEDRSFAANRNDQATFNLFGLAGIGQNAAAGTAAAGNAFASNTINSNNQRAGTTANAAIANAQNTSNLFGSAAGALGTYYGLKGRI